MVSEIRSQFDIGAMLHNISTITLTKTQKRWRLAYFSIYFSNTMLSIAKVSKKLSDQYPISEIVAGPSYTALKIIPKEATNSEDHSDGFSSIDQSELSDLVKNKDLEIVSKFNGVSGLAEALQTNLENGINGQDTERREIVFGSNTYKKPPPKGFFYFVVEAFMDTTILILLACAALSLGFGIKEEGAKEGWYEGGSILVAVFLVITVSAVSNFRQERQFDRLSKISNNIKIDAIREGRMQKILIFDVVVGDVVVLNIGDQIPADGLFIDGHSLVVDESSMAGSESDDHIEIDAIRHPFLISGSKVVDGNARMIVTSVGMNTTWGKMMSSEETDEQTPLQSRLNKLITLIRKVSCVFAFLDLLSITVRCFMKVENGNRTDTIVIPFVTRAVLAIPEGLSLALTVTLASSIKGMMGDQAMVRKLPACETMGRIDVICTHKTGILTMNDQMEVTKFWVGLDYIQDNSSIDAKVLQLYHQGVGLNTTGSVYKSVSGNTSEYSGSPTEKAILSWAVTNLGMDKEKLKQGSTILHVETFNSEKKMSGVLIEKKEDNTIHVHWKGAAEMVLAMCSNYYQKSGHIKSITDDEKTQLEKTIEGMAASGLRCIAFAHKQISEKELKNNESEDGKTLNEQGLTLLGIIGIMNSCRPGVKEDIETCRSAGVDVKMLTGDNIFTAKAIATEIGILEAGPHVSKNINGQVVEGEEFRNYTDEERMEKVDRIRVMARASPSDKLLMVQCLKKKGHKVLYTGDHTSDVPGLKEADIGVSMGIQGTQVAKENSDIVILDDNFHSIVMALSPGRCVFHNIQKFIQFQLTPNVAAFVINFISDACDRGVPLTTVQMLWVNLIMVTFGALAHATEINPTKEVMLQKPFVGIQITNVMWRNLLAQSLYQIVILLIFWFKGRSFFNVNERVNGMIIFNTFILCQVFHLFNSRKLEKMNVFEGLHKNIPFLGIVGLFMVLHVVMVEFSENVADTQKLNMEQWGICLAFASLSWPIGWFVKLIPVPEAPFLSYI